MKKGILSKIIVMFMVVLLGLPVIAATVRVRVVVNGEKVLFPDAQPYMDENNRILIPVRFVSEELGAKVGWEQSKKQVTISDTKNTVTLVIGKKEITVNGKTKTLDTAASVKSTRTYVPLRFVSEALGATVEWDSKGRSVYITNNGKPIVKDKVITHEGFSIVIDKGDEYSPQSYGDYILTSTKFSIITSDDPQNKLIMILQSCWGMTGGDYYKQCDEMEALLSQKVSQSCVDKVMKYVRSKTKDEAWLDKKEFLDKNYKITVISNPNSVVEVSVYNK